jgi:hypothetical protein
VIYYVFCNLISKCKIRPFLDHLEVYKNGKLICSQSFDSSFENDYLRLLSELLIIDVTDTIVFDDRQLALNEFLKLNASNRIIDLNQLLESAS